jgi:hypothetical protein
VLKQTYPEFSFEIGSATGQPSLTIVILNATKSDLRLQLKWRTFSGKVIEGQSMSISIMDKGLNAARRHSLYLRALTATPMPKPD